MKNTGRSLFAMIIGLLAFAAWSVAQPAIRSNGPALWEWSGLKTQEIPEARRGQIEAAYGQLPLSFEANQGQVDRRVEFLSRGSGYTLFLTQTEAVLSLNSGKDGPGAALRMKLAGAQRHPDLSGMDPLPGTANYFVGRNAVQWHTGVATYRKVNCRGVYPGIDLTYYGNQKELEYDFVVAPGADPKAIAIEFAGASAMEISPEGDLVLRIAGREVREHKPVVFQDIAGVRRVVAGRYVLEGSRRVRFQIGSYDRRRALIIDPTLAYSTYLSGSSYDQANGIAVDSAGNAYVTGQASSSNFPTTAGAFQTTLNGGSNAFVTKLDATGTALVYSTYLGGSSFDSGLGIAVDASGNAYVTGSAPSSNFPTTPGAFQTTNGSAFVTKLNATGTALVYSTYLGGSGSDGGFGIAVDASGNAYVTGGTSSSNFPTTAGAFQTTIGSNSNAFVTKLNATGTALAYSTYLAGSTDQYGAGIAVDSSGNAYVMGPTNSSDFPVTPGAFQTTLNGMVNTFVTKLNAAGTALAYSTYLGGSRLDYGYGIALDSSANAYVTGYTFSNNFPVTPGAYQTTHSGGNTADVFVSKLNGGGTALVYSTYLSGSSNVNGSIAVDSAGSAYVTGYTAASGFPTTPGAFQTTLNGSLNAFFTELNAAGTALLYSTYLGGSGFDQANGIAVGGAGNAYVTGQASSSNFPTSASAFQTTNAGIQDAFVTKFVLPAPLTITSLAADPNALWPPNHKLVPVTVIAGTSGGSGAVSCNIVSVSSNEPIDAGGDWVITGPLTLELVAARDGNGTGRVYTITVQCTDGIGNGPTATVSVKVPHDQGN